jgi:hypothetical protein
MYEEFAESQLLLFVSFAQDVEQYQPVESRSLHRVRNIFQRLAFRSRLGLRSISLAPWRTTRVVKLYRMRNRTCAAI